MMELEETQKKMWTDTNKSQCALKSRADLLKIYRTDDDKPDFKTVDAIIKRKWDAGLYEEDPDAPGHYLYYARGKTTFTSSHASHRELTLRARAKLDKTAAEKLTSKGGLFGEDDAAGVTKKGFKTLEAPKQIVPAVAALALRTVKGAAVAAASSDSKAGADNGEGGKRTQKGSGKGLREQNQKSKQLHAKTPVEKAREIAHKCLEDSAKARTLLEKLTGIQMAESMREGLNKHATFFTDFYHKLMAMVREDKTEEADYAPLLAEIVVQRKPYQDDYEFAQTVATGLHKPKSAARGKAKAKAKS